MLMRRFPRDFSNCTCGLISTSLSHLVVQGRVVILIGMFCFSGCERKSDEVFVEETRPLTSRDREPKLYASSNERFRNAKPAPIRGESPKNWLALPASQFRELNYRFGESGRGEVYVSILSGSVPDNVNRWRRQFGDDQLTPAEFSKMEKIQVAGGQGVWIELDGSYASGMGSAETLPGYALAGVVAKSGEKIVTVKMLGPRQEVLAETDALRKFVASLELIK